MLKADLAPYAGKRMCVALSGGRDSMALLHYLHANGAEYGITLSAVNCDHCMRGEESARDSAFVKDYCARLSIPLYFFSAEGLNLSGERSAREWRLSCFDKVLAEGRADCIATAHHMNDNAETVLFNLARGSSLAGLCGIAADTSRGFVRPFIGVSRADIDEYVRENAIPFVTDSTNLCDDYTRNKIRHAVIPALEGAVSGAVGNIYRFSRLAAEDEEYLSRIAAGYISKAFGGYLIAPCREKVIFRRAAHAVVADYFKKKDYTSLHFEKLYALQCAQKGKKFSFLGLDAISEREGISITPCRSGAEEVLPFGQALGGISQLADGLPFCIVPADSAEKWTKALSERTGAPIKALYFDMDCIPESAQIRSRRAGDRFTPFGGGTKSLGDYLTDKKVPQSLRSLLPLIVADSRVLAVGGVEISDGVKLTQDTSRRGAFICPSATK